MAFDLAAMARASGARRRQIVIRDIQPPATLAAALYRECYAPIIDAWRERLPQIEATYARTLAEMVTDAPADVEADLSAAHSAIQAILLGLAPRVRAWAMRTERWYRGRWRGAVLAASRVDLATMLGPEAARRSLEQTVAWNTSLIRDVSDQIRQRIGGIVFSGLRERRPAREVAREIREAVGMGRDRSIRIASDQLNKLTSDLADERRREAGIRKWRWRHSGKKHPRQTHKARDGRTYTDKTAPPDRPGQLPYCGCRAQAVLELDGEEVSI